MYEEEAMDIYTEWSNANSSEETIDAYTEQLKTAYTLTPDHRREVFMVGDRVTLVPGAEQKTQFAREGTGKVVSLEYGLERGALLNPRWYEIKWDNYPEESPFYYRRDLVIRAPIGEEKHQPYTLPEI